jgi:hypothetical protein
VFVLHYVERQTVSRGIQTGESESDEECDYMVRCSGEALATGKSWTTLQFDLPPWTVMPPDAAKRKRFLESSSENITACEKSRFQENIA